MIQKVFVVIVNYNQPELTIKCINSIKKSNGVVPFVILVDNNSEDNSVDLFIKKYNNDRSVHIIESKINNGFAAGNNIGINYAIDNGAEYILLLNNDTEIDPKMIHILVNSVDEKTAVSPKMYYFDKPDTIWFAGGKYSTISGKFTHIGENKKDCELFNSVVNCDFLTGCCIMIKTETIKKVGLLDESYFMYMEDVDYSLKLKKEGIELLMIPEAKLWHKVGSSSGGEKSKTAIYYGNRNRLFLLKKFNFPFFIRTTNILSRILLMINGFVFNTNKKIIFYSIKDFYLNIRGKRNLDI